MSMSDRLLREFRERAESLVPVPDLGELRRRGLRLRRARIAAGAAVPASALAIGGAVATSSITDKDSIGPAQSHAEEIASGFLDAYGAFDADRAITYLTDDAITEAFGSAEGLRLELLWNQAIGTKWLINDCEPQGGSADGIAVRCAFDFHAIRSGEIGLGPYTGSYWDLAVRDGKVVSATLGWAWTNGFSLQMWGPFALWVATTYPGDVPVMYTDRAQGMEARSEESIPLWEQRAREYVAAVRRDPAADIDQPEVGAYIARVESICTAAQARLVGESLEALGMAPPDLSADDREAFLEDVVPRWMGQTLVELRAVVLPAPVRARYEHDFMLLAQEADVDLRGAGVSHNNPPGWPASHFVHQSLQGCTAGG